MEKKDKQEEEQYRQPNDFSGNTFGQSQMLKVFTGDINRGECATRRWGNYFLTLHSSKRGLFTLESPNSVLVGTGNVFAVDYYTDYLHTFPQEVLEMMQELFDEYNLTDCNAILFAINNTVRVLPAGDGFYNLYFPDNSFFMVSGNIYEVLPGDLLEKNDQMWGYRLSRWVRKQLHRYQFKRRTNNLSE